MKNASKEINDFLEIYKEFNVIQNLLTAAIRKLRKYEKLDADMIELLEIQANFLNNKNKAFNKILKEEKEND